MEASTHDGSNGTDIPFVTQNGTTLSDELATAGTKKKEFLDRMDHVIPWRAWCAMIRPHYYSGEHGNKPYDLELMLRLYVLQNLYDLADMSVVDQTIDSRAFSQFCGVDSSNQVPNGDTVGRFCNLLMEHDLQERLFAQVVRVLEEEGLLLKKGSIVDSSLIAAPPSTKNAERKRDPEAHQTKKGNAWHFGYKAHIGVDCDSGLVHHVVATAANEHDLNVLPDLLTGEEETVHGDSGYLGAEKRKEAILRNNKGKRVRYKINRRPSQIAKLTKSGQAYAKKAERKKSSVRAKVEHVFAVVKGLFHFRKTRYRGLRRQSAKLHITMALANLYLADTRYALA